MTPAPDWTHPTRLFPLHRPRPDVALKLDALRDKFHGLAMELRALIPAPSPELTLAERALHQAQQHAVFALVAPKPGASYGQPPLATGGKVDPLDNPPCRYEHEQKRSVDGADAAIEEIREAKRQLAHPLEGIAKEREGYGSSVGRAMGGTKPPDDLVAGDPCASTVELDEAGECKGPAEPVRRGGGVDLSTELMKDEDPPSAADGESAT